MKKQYIIPNIEIEQVEEVQFLCFSKGVPEGTTPEIETKPIEVDKGLGSETGEGLNDAKGNTHFFGIEW